MSYDLPGELTAEHIHTARDLGASNICLALAVQHPERADIERNFVTDNLVLMLEDTDGEINPSDDELDRMGHFMTAVWDGDVPEAIYRADIKNTKLIFNTLSEPYLVAMLVSSRGSLEAANRYKEGTEESYL
jgi:hypothetical protein